MRPSYRSRWIVLNDEINSARDATKTNTVRVDTFRSPELGCATSGPGSVVLSRREGIKGVCVSARRLLALLGTVSLASPATVSLESAVANDNRTPAGTMLGDTLVLRLSVTPAQWHILGESQRAVDLLAFAEEGKPPMIPAPLIRTRIGTPIRVELRNPLADTLVVRGLGERGGVRDSVVLLPGEAKEVRFVARHAGTHAYWGNTVADQRLVPVRGRSGGLIHNRREAALGGALIVDSAGAVPADRIFVINEFVDRGAAGAFDRHGTPTREFTTLNGRSWPNTERLRVALGDTVRWRIVNTSFQVHPMHLHGFYFRVDSHGTPGAPVDSIYSPEQRRMAVTEPIGPGETVSIVWSPDRPGGWIFHCHLTSHAAKMPPIGFPDSTGFPATHHDGDPDRHVLEGMSGLVLGVDVTGDGGTTRPWRPARRLRLFVQSNPAAGDSASRFGYVLQRGAQPRPDSVEYPGPVLVLRRGEPTSITVVNRSDEPTAVHWHGIELESYYDGAVGWGRMAGSSGRPTPAIRPGSSFEVRITPRRAGTFMYHTHFNEMRQQYGGLVGALEAGRTYRLRIADIAVFRYLLNLRLVRDSALLSWRPIAKDGFTLPAAQATARPSAVNLPSGETADFEFTPDRPGELALELWSGPGGGSGGIPMLHGRLPFLVAPAAGGSGSAESSGARARPRR
jgi:multicopper oxidase